MNKNLVIIVRVSDTEKDSFEKASKLSGISLSSWARQKLRSAAIKDLQDVGEKVPFLTPATYLQTV